MRPTGTFHNDKGPVTTLGRFNNYKWITLVPKQKLTELKGEIDNSTIGAGDFSTLLIVTDRTTRQKISKDIYRRHDHKPSPNNPLRQTNQAERKELEQKEDVHGPKP